jgi:two-component system, chemotaxis family, protein-glutamate methylesterase/glutaminase
MTYELVTIGASWGGLAALRVLLGALPDDFGAAVVVAQHRGARTEESLLPNLLNAQTGLAVRDAEDKDALLPGEVLVAPPDYHLLVEPGSVALSCDEPVAFSRPSIDVLFETAADAYGERMIAVVLTGSNGDGAEGLKAVRRRGGAAIVQDPEDAERPEMPRAALEAVPSARKLTLAEIGPRLGDMVGAAARSAER